MRLRTFAILCLAFASIHLRIYVTQPGLDPSWEFALNHAHASTDYVFGRDIVFTYGPLGFLARPHAIGTNIQQAALFSGVLALLAALSISLFGDKARNRAGFWLFFAGFTIANAFGLWEEYYYSSVLALCLLAGKFFESRFLLIAAGALGPVLLMLKFSTGLAAASMIGITVLALPWRRALLLIAPYVAVLLASVAIFFHGPATFFRWLWFSLEVATGYGVAMSLSGPTIEAVAGILLAATLWLSAILARGRQLQFPLLLFAVPVLLALKHAAVGQNHMTAGLFLFLVSIAGVLALFATGRRETYAVAALLVVTITVAAAKGISATGNPPVTPLRFFRFFTAQKVREAIGRTVRSDKSPGQFGARSLPAAWLQPLRESPGVDVLPFELSYIAQYGLRWRPNFILQNYSAYTARLDHEVAENIRAGVRAPDMLLLEFIGIDGRHLLLDTPENFRAILARYQVVGVDYARNLLLVRRRPAIERQPAPFASPARRSASGRQCPRRKASSMPACASKRTWPGA